MNTYHTHSTPTLQQAYLCFMQDDYHPNFECSCSNANTMVCLLDFRHSLRHAIPYISKCIKDRYRAKCGREREG